MKKMTEKENPLNPRKILGLGRDYTELNCQLANLFQRGCDYGFLFGERGEHIKVDVGGDVGNGWAGAIFGKNNNYQKLKDVLDLLAPSERAKLTNLGLVDAVCVEY